MPDRILGIVVSGSQVIAVGLQRAGSKFELIHNQKMKIQDGDRGIAYSIMHSRLRAMLQENSYDVVAVKGSSVSLAGTKQAHLDAAELRGAVLAACAAECTVVCEKRAALSRNFGNRKADEYLTDDQFWKNELIGDLPKGEREAALFALSAGNAK